MVRAVPVAALPIEDGSINVEMDPEDQLRATQSLEESRLRCACAPCASGALVPSAAPIRRMPAPDRWSVDAAAACLAAVLSEHTAGADKHACLVRARCMFVLDYALH